MHHAAWPFDSHVLVIDRDDTSRAACVDQLIQFGCVCHSADSHERAVELFCADPEIDIVLLDYSLPGVGPTAVARDLVEIRSNVTIVGMSDRVSEFTCPDVKLFLLKPWSVRDLVEVLQDRLTR